MAEARVSRRAATLSVTLTTLLVVAVLLSLLVGARQIAPGTVIDALLHGGGTEDRAIVREVRLPRTLLGLLAGTGLAVAGALMQGLTRNPLAEPGILGVSSGAAFAVVLATFALGKPTPSATVWFALAGAALASIVVYAIGRGSVTPVRFSLAGAVLSSLLSSWSYATMTIDRRTAEEARFWLAGSLSGRSMQVFLTVLPFVGAGLVLSLLLIRSLNLLALGDDVATALGAPPGPVRIVGLLAVALLAGGAVAGAGPIAFVGLAVPHLVRLISGPDHRRLLPGCLLLGPALLLLADVLGRIVLRPTEIEVGIMTALLGAPMLIVLAMRMRPGRPS